MDHDQPPGKVQAFTVWASQEPWHWWGGLWRRNARAIERQHPFEMFRHLSQQPPALDGSSQGQRGDRGDLDERHAGTPIRDLAPGCRLDRDVTDF